MTKQYLHLSASPLGSRILRGAAAGLVINAAGNLFLFVGQLLIPRILTRTEYAEFTVTISFIALMAMIADLGMNPLIVRRLAQAEEDASLGRSDIRGRLLGTSLALRIILSMIVALVVISIGPLLYPPSMVRNFLILLVTLLISSRILAVRSAAESIIRSQGKYYLVALFAMLDAVAFALLLFLSRHQTLRLEGILWIYSLCNLPGFGFVVIWIVRWAKREKVLLRVDVKLAWELFRVSLPLCLGSIFLTVHTQIDSLLLYRLSTPIEVSSYGATMRLSAAMAPFSLVLAAVTAPELTRLLRREDLSRALKLTDISLRMLLVTGTAIALLVTALADIIVPFMLGGQYNSASSLLIWTGWMLIPIFAATLLMDLSIAAGFAWYMTANAGLCMVTVIVGDLILIPSNGAAGAMASKLIAVTLGAGLMVWLSRNAGHLDARHFASASLRTGLAAVVALGVFWATRAWWLGQIPSAIAMLAVYYVVVHFTRVLPFAEVVSLLKRIRPTAGRTNA